MSTFVYKRTHPFDPNKGGVFGIEDCMGALRKLPFENVIGIGGICAEAKFHHIDSKINWIGVGAQKIKRRGRGPMIVFAHFLLWEKDGQLLRDKYPNLAKRFLKAKGPRSALYKFSKPEQREIDQILALAKDAPSSTGDMTPDRPWPCRPVCRPKRKC